jgi:hypothetical protein
MFSFFKNPHFACVDENPANSNVKTKIQSNLDLMEILFYGKNFWSLQQENLQN